MFLDRRLQTCRWQGKKRLAELEEREGRGKESGEVRGEGVRGG